jgi:CHAT domain-containing protein
MRDSLASPDPWLIRIGVLVFIAMTSGSSFAFCQTAIERGRDDQRRARIAQPASAKVRFRVGTLRTREDVAPLQNGVGGQPDGEPAKRTSDPRAEQRKQRDAAVWDAQRLAEEAYSEEALAVARRVVTVQRALVPESHRDIAAALTWYASIAKTFARFDEARVALREAYQIRVKAQGANDWRTVDARYALERAERLVGLDAQHREKYRAAQQVLVRSTRLKHPQPYDGAQILQLEREALTLLKEALGENHPEYAFCLDSFVNNTSFLWRNSNSDAAKAIREEHRLLSTQAQAIRRQTLGERHPNYALSLWNSQSTLPATRDRSNPALQALLRQVLEIRAATLGKHHPAYLRTLDNLGIIVQWKPEQGLAEAEAIFREALDLGRVTYGADDTRLVITFSRLAGNAQESGDLDKAERMAREVVRLRRKIYAEGSRPWSDIWSDLSITVPAYSTDRPSRLLATRKVFQLNLLASLRHLAQILAQKGDLAGAARCIEETTDISESDLAFTVAWSVSKARESVDWDFRTLDTYLTISFDPAASIKPDDAYRRAFAKKGAFLVYDQLARRLRKRPDLAPLFAELEEVSSETGRLGAAPPEPGNSAAWRRLYALMSRQDELETKLADRFIRLGLTDTGGVRVEDLPAALPAETALVDFFEVSESRGYFMSQPVDPRRQPQEYRGEGKIVSVPGALDPHLQAFVIRKDGQIIQLDFGPSRPIADAIDQWRAQAQRLGDVSFAAASLRRLLWEPLEPHLSGVRTLFVSPDGSLCRLPLAALPGKERGTFLIDDLTMAVVPVPQLLVSKSPTPLSSSNLLLVGDIDFGADPGPASAAKLPTRSPIDPGDPKRAKRSVFRPLPGTRFEIEAISALFSAAHPGSQGRTLRGSAATEGAFRAALPGSRFVHLATHGFFDFPANSSSMYTDSNYYRSPQFLANHSPGLFAGLVFAGANGPPSQDRDDGIFTALEAKEHDLGGVELMVLSACESSLGADTNREGLLGLQRAFHVAGVRSLISSLWPVNDGATSVLMEEFYTNLWQRKLRPPEALPERVLKRWDELVAKSPRSLGENPRRLPSGGAVRRRSPIPWWAGFVLSEGDRVPVPLPAAGSGASKP